MTPRMSKSNKPFKLHREKEMDIHAYIYTLQKHNPPEDRQKITEYCYFFGLIFVISAVMQYS